METKFIVMSLVLGAVLIGGAMLYSPNGSTKQVNHLNNNETNTNMLTTVSASTFASKNSVDERIIIDVRTPAEYEAGHIKGSQNIDSSSPTFRQDIDTLDKTKQYSVYCRSGNRSGQALKLMESLGFEDVIDLGGGIIAWGQVGEDLCSDC